MSKIIDTIKNRRSIFPGSFSDKKISDEVIVELLQAANQAPSHKKANPWRFKVVSGDGLDRLGDFFMDTYKRKTSEEKYDLIKQKNLKKKVLKSSHVLIITTQLNPANGLPEWEEIAATSCAVQNLWLACEELGVGGYWSSPRFYMDEINDFIQMNEHEICLGFFYLGVPMEGLEFNVDKGDVNDRVDWIRS